MSAENTNCLEGMACPECGYTERFKIIALTTATIADDGCEDHEDLEYDERARCECVSCGHVATVGVFAGRPPKLAFPEERMAVASTAHVTQEDSEAISKLIRIGTINGMTREFGWLIHVDSNDGDIPALNAVLSGARESGFHWVLLDSDGDQIEGLPVYDW